MVSVKVKVNSAPLAKLRGGLATLNRVPSHPAIDAMRGQWLKRVEAFTRRRFSQFSRGGGDWPALAASTIAKRRAAGSTSIAKGKNIIREGGLDYRKSKSGKLSLVAQAVARDTTRGGGTVVSNRRAAILNDTGTLFASLTIKANGNVADSIPGGVRYGIQGGQSRKRAKITRKLVSKKTGKTRTGRVFGSVSASPSVGQIATWHHFGKGNNPARRIVVNPDQATLGAMSNDLARAVSKINAEAKGAR